MGAEPRGNIIPPLGLYGVLPAPEPRHGVVVFARGSDGSRLSPRNAFVAAATCQGGPGTLLFDLLPPEEAEDWRKVFDIPQLAKRLMNATGWLTSPASVSGAVPIGYFGGSTGAAAMLAAAALRPDRVCAVDSPGGRPDLAGLEVPSHTRAPTLLIVGSLDEEVLALNRSAAAQMPAAAEIRVVQGTGHQFEEPGTLGAVVVLARDRVMDRVGRLP
ncbi:alpha/beta hydrolase [Belnapia sp. T6]|uniref:Alpha/beta hydrolase n=1 Tax=Belnapia mucosa TaxID=2804532 RepID=A0ABS1VBN7_9PROT|nr:alpha/beta hydrolase [Belnapia mucosa]MBL6459089.1 alpha/beta hydrolase [Belnapia mucosa]